MPNNDHAYLTDLGGTVWSSTPVGWGSTDIDRDEYNSAVADTRPDLKYTHHCAIYIQCAKYLQKLILQEKSSTCLKLDKRLQTC